MRWSKAILVVGLAMAITGYLINYFSGKDGLIHLQRGISGKLSISTSSDSTSSTRHNLGFSISLDTLIFEPHVPVYEIELLRKDTVRASELPAFETPPPVLIDRYPLEEMKIRKIGTTDLRFRLKQYYPDFTFKYTYPEKRDTIRPVAPGILLELMTKQGPQIVTLYGGNRKPNRIDDIVGLGTSFDFFWQLSSDSVTSIFKKDSLFNKVLLVGLDQKVYLHFNGTTEEKNLEEHTYYKIPGQDSVGFNILYCVPDVAYLNASPSTKSQKALNPVANVEIWKLGGGAKEAFIYPESNLRKGGEYRIPDSDYMLNLAVSQKDAVRFCNCTISVKNQEGLTLKSLVLKGGHSKSFHQYHFTPIACDTHTRDNAIISVTHRPGNIPLCIGFFLCIACLGFILIQKFS